MLFIAKNEKNENMIELKRLWHSNAIFSGNKNDIIVKEKMYMIFVELNVGAEKKTIFYEALFKTANLKQKKGGGSSGSWWNCGGGFVCTVFPFFCWRKKKVVLQQQQRFKGFSWRR